MTDVVLDGDATAAWPEQEVAGGAERDDGDDSVAVPGHRVAAVPVKAHPRGTERLTELGLIVGVQRIPRSGEGRIREHLTLPLEAQSPRHEPHPLVHLPTLLDPIDAT